MTYVIVMRMHWGSEKIASMPRLEPPVELPTRPGKVRHKNQRHHGKVLRDIIIGFADGLTVPFALTAGLSS